MNELRSDFAASLSFLALIYPEGPWKLTAISVDKKAIDSRTFGPEDEDEAIKWLQLYEKRNLYYSVNPPTQEARDLKKCEKVEVARVHYLHVDVDPRAGEDVESEQRRILEQLLTYRIEPTVVVFSGGGYNALWKLLEPIPVADGGGTKDEIVARAVDVERRNWQFELDFSTPDHCRDVSRILRLPGTLNRPNAEKIAKGRTIALARVVKVNWEPEKESEE